MDDWDSLKAEFGWSAFSRHKTKIIVVTNELYVARHCVNNNNNNVVNIKGMDVVAFFRLFCRKVHTAYICPK
jgi:hypothetical protein